MASLKEVKRRIVSVEGTKKITVARQMISSALLHKTQDTLVKIRAYKDAIDDLYGKIDISDANTIHYTHKTEPKKTGVILISSNSGMCGPYNMNIIKEASLLEEYYPGETLIFFPIGKKIREILLHKGLPLGYEDASNMDYLIEKPSFEKSSKAISFFSNLFNSGTIDSLIVVYTHFNSISNLKVISIPLLPYVVSSNEDKSNFIIEPTPTLLLSELLEKSLRAAFHKIIIDSLTSECAARTIAMQLASENANDLLSDLHINYNKLRQQNITTELLDIIGSSFA